MAAKDERNNIDPEAQLEEILIRAMKNGDLGELEGLLDSDKVKGNPVIFNKLLQKSEELTQDGKLKPGDNLLKIRKLMSSRAKELVDAMDSKNNDLSDKAKKSLESLRGTLDKFNEKSELIKEQVQSKKSSSSKPKREEKRSQGAKEITKNEKFLQAVKDGKVGEAAKLLGEGADVNCRDKNGKSALQIANDMGHEEMADYLTSITSQNAAPKWSGIRMMGESKSSQGGVNLIGSASQRQSIIDAQLEKQSLMAQKAQDTKEIMDRLEMEYQEGLKKMSHFKPGEVKNDWVYGQNLEENNEFSYYNPYTEEVDTITIDQDVAEVVNLLNDLPESKKEEALSSISGDVHNQGEKICSQFLAQAIREGNVTLIAAIMAQPDFDVNQSSGSYSLYQIAKSSGNEFILSLLESKGARTQEHNSVSNKDAKIDSELSPSLENDKVKEVPKVNIDPDPGTKIIPISNETLAERQHNSSRGGN